MNDDKQQRIDPKIPTIKEMLEWRREQRRLAELGLENEFYDIFDADDSSSKEDANTTIKKDQADKSA